jgi:hypothetical protein
MKRAANQAALFTSAKISFRKGFVRLLTYVDIGFFEARKNKVTSILFGNDSSQFIGKNLFHFKQFQVLP